MQRWCNVGTVSIYAMRYLTTTAISSSTADFVSAFFSKSFFICSMSSPSTSSSNYFEHRGGMGIGPRFPSTASLSDMWTIFMRHLNSPVSPTSSLSVLSISKLTFSLCIWLISTANIPLLLGLRQPVGCDHIPMGYPSWRPSILSISVKNNFSKPDNSSLSGHMISSNLL